MTVPYTNSKHSKKLLSWIEYAILIVVTIATVIAVAKEIVHMIKQMDVTVADLLLLFIYLEVISMVAAYLRSGKVPVRMPMYIAIVALARYLILDMKGMEAWTMIAIAGAVLLIAVAVLVIRFGHAKYPYDDPPSEKVKITS